MRELIARRFDVVIVIWAIALGFAWTVGCLWHCQSQLDSNQWASAPAGPVWMIDR